jgi:hypothetical protein
MQNNNLKLKNVLIEFKEIELINENLTEGNGSVNVDNWCNFVNNFWNKEIELCENRDIVLEDLKKNKGYIYNLLVKWYNELEKSNEFEGLMWYEYSLEDVIRDCFNNEDEYSLVKLGSFKEINDMVYYKES